jgi:membrane protease subunit HflC
MAAIVIALIFAAALVAYQVRQTEVAVVTTFGKTTRTNFTPGLKLRLPWPIERVYKFDNRIHNYSKKYEQTTTSDGRIIIIEVFVGWRVADPGLFLERFHGDLTSAESSLEGLVRDTKNSTVGRHPFSDFVSTEKADFKSIEEEMLQGIKSKAAEAYGIDIALLGIKQIGLPESITTKVFERMKAEREQLVRQYRGEGEAEALRIRSEADAEKERILAEAASEVETILGDAEARTAKELRTFEQNPELAVFLLKLRALEQSMKERATLVLDPRTVPFDLLQGAEAMPNSTPEAAATAP